MDVGQISCSHGDRSSRVCVKEEDWRKPRSHPHPAPTYVIAICLKMVLRDMSGKKKLIMSCEAET